MRTYPVRFGVALEFPAGCPAGTWSMWEIAVPAHVLDRGSRAVEAYGTAQVAASVRAPFHCWIISYDKQDVGIDIHRVMEISQTEEAVLVGCGADVRVQALGDGVSVAIYAQDADPPDAVAEAWATYDELGLDP